MGATAYLTARRREALDTPEGTTFGMPNAAVVPVFKYLVTLNIKVVGFLWASLSPWLSEQENFRTDAELKSAMVLKLFAVKFVIFYYPFIYTLFIQPNMEGCDGGTMEGRDVSGLLRGLKLKSAFNFHRSVNLEACVGPLSGNC